MMKKILVTFCLVLMMVGMTFASQPLFQGQYTIDGVDGATNTGWRLTGTFEDASLLGYSASDCATNDRIYVYSSFGDLDLYRITNLVSVVGSSLSVDVVYDETGTPRAGAPVPGIQIMCRPGYDGYASFLPSLTFGQFTEYLQNGARNLNLKYAIMYAASNGIQGATISAGASDSVVTNNKILVITWNTNAAGGGGVGTITNMLSGDGSIVWSESGGPQPDGSVTAYVAGVVVGYGTTGQIAALQGATNALNTRVGSLETSTGTLNTAVGNLNTATNNINGRVSGIEANTTKWEIAYTDASSATGNVILLQGATNALNTRATNLEGATGALNTAVGNLQTATGSLNTAVGNLNNATNVLNTRATNLEGATGSLNTAVGNLNTATNNLNTRVTGIEGQTNLIQSAVQPNDNVSSLSNDAGYVTSAESEPLWTSDSNNVWTAIGNLNGATNALEGRVAGLEGATGDYYQASNPDGFVAGLIKAGDTATTQGKIYQQLSDGTWQQTYNTNVEYCNKAIGIAYGTNSSSAGMIVIGAVTVTNEDLVIGSNIYVGATAGEWTQTVPSSDGDIIRAVGYAKNTNEIYVTPSPVWVEIGSLISENTDFNTFNATNIGLMQSSSIQITGGNPTNGATWIATNALGQGKFSKPVGFFATQNSDLIISNNVERTVVFAAEQHDYDNNFDGTTFTAPCNGSYSIGAQIFNNAGSSAYMLIVIYINSTKILWKNSPRIATAGEIWASANIPDYYLTNGATVHINARGQSGYTNTIYGSEAAYNYFSVHLNNEIP